MTDLTTSPRPLAISRDGDYNSRHPEETLRVIATYRSRAVGEHWNAIEQIVRSSVSQLPPISASAIRYYLVAVSRFAHWVYTVTGLPLDRAEEVFQHYLIRRFAREELSSHDKPYQYAILSRLGAIADLYGDTDPHRATPEVGFTETIYSSREIAALSISVRRRDTVLRRHQAQTLLALGLGAGLRSEELTRARVDWITLDGDTATVQVPNGPHPRMIPVRHDWVRTLRGGIGDRNAEDWAIPGYRNPKVPSRVLAQIGIDDASEPHPQPTRMRATWAVGHLERGLPLDLFMQIAGIDDPGTLRNFLVRMAPRSVADFRSQITGEVAP